MRNVVCLAAKGVVRDAATNTISVYAIIEDLLPEGFPFLIQEMAVLSIWRRDSNEAGQYDLTLSIELNGKVLNATEVQVDFQKALANHTIINIGGMIIPESGVLRFVFQRGDTMVAEYGVAIAAPAPRIEAADRVAPKRSRARRGSVTASAER
jgi:hypothetical protein